MRETSYDKRIVRYEEIHEVQPADLATFVSLGRVSDGCRVLDLGCGYGAVTTTLIRSVSQPDSGVRHVAIDLLDESRVQLERARDEVGPLVQSCVDRVGITTAFCLGSFPADFETWRDRYDVIYAKQVIHEVPQKEQLPLIRRLFDILRPGGRLIVWEIALDEDPEVGNVFRRAITYKDRLAGFETLQTNRHFLDRPQLLRMLKEGGGALPTVSKTVRYRFRSALRLHTELGGRIADLVSLNKYICQEKDCIAPAKQLRLKLEEVGQSVEFDVPVVIASVVKPHRATLNSLSLLADREFEKPEASTLRREVVEAAIAGTLGTDLFSALGPSLLRFTVVEWDRQRRLLAPAGLDFVLSWDINWERPARAYTAYLASLFASAQGNPDRSFAESATGFLANWFAELSAAAIAHFELDGDALRVTALTIRKVVVGETTFHLPHKWQQVLEIFHRLAKNVGPLTTHPVGPSAVRLSWDSSKTVDELAQQMAVDAAAFGNKLLAEVAARAGWQRPGHPSADLMLRLASYLHLAESNHAYYFLPSSLVFKRLPGMKSKTTRLEVGNLHVTTREPIDPDTGVELLHWQGAIWQNIGSAGALAALIKAHPNP